MRPREDPAGIQNSGLTLPAEHAPNTALEALETFFTRIVASRSPGYPCLGRQGKYCLYCTGYEYGGRPSKRMLFLTALSHSRSPRSTRSPGILRTGDAKRNKKKKNKKKGSRAEKGSDESRRP